MHDVDKEDDLFSDYRIIIIIQNNSYCSGKCSDEDFALGLYLTDL